MTKIRRALISVSDKTNIVAFAKDLIDANVEILTTGGTALLLREAGLPITEVSDYTGFPEMFDGRVKTLHPKIHGGILARREVPSHVASMREQAILSIDLVCVNLYPFEATVAKPGVSLEDAIENIDIGGPALIRSAAKNWPDVAVITDIQDYTKVIDELKQQGCLTRLTRFALARKAFCHTAAYDGAIANYLSTLTTTDTEVASIERMTFPDRLTVQFVKIQDMRYGENPHQSAAFYRDLDPAPGTIANYRQLQGKALSYNNVADADAAWQCVNAFSEPACVIVKHTNPCGAAIATEPAVAYRLALATDATSAFGGVVAFNREVDRPTAEALQGQFLEIIIAPSFSEQALALLASRGALRLLALSASEMSNRFDFKRVGGGVLVQTPDELQLLASELKVVSRRTPSEAQLNDLLFAWRVAKYVKSNAIVLAAQGQTVGLGVGQTSRVDSAAIALRKAEQANLSPKGAVAASDAFFPFRDGIDVLAQQGISAIIQPGGSVRDAEVIAAADEYGLVMVVTGCRHFRH